MQYLINRLREPSTWSGFGLLASMFGVPAGTFGLVQQVVMGAAGLASVLCAERGATAPVQEPSGP